MDGPENACSTALSGATAVIAGSLHANLQTQSHRLGRHVAALERRLSEMLGEQVYRVSDIDAAHKIAGLQRQRVLDLQQHLDDRTDERAPAHAASRELMAALNRR
jgi:hypothetical protein